MPTILTKKSDTPGAVPATGNLTNAAGGAELAVNTADKRLFTITSGSQVVELGTNPSSLTCADGSFTLLKAASASITNLTATSLVLSNLSIASANVTTLTSASATITNLLATTLTISGGTANGVLYLNASKVATSGSAIQFDGTNLLIGTTSGTNKLTVNGNAVLLANGEMKFADSTNSRVSVIKNSGGASTSQIDFLTGDPVTTRMTLDTSGNLGLGVTPSAWYTLSTVFQSNGYAFEGRSGTPDYSAYWTNAYLNAAGSAFIYRSNGYASGYLQASGVHRWRTAASGTAGGTISFTETMTLDASGNLGVGTTSPGQKLEVAGNIFINSSGNPYMEIKTSGAGNNPYLRLTASSTYWDVAGIFSDSTDPLQFAYGGSEKARITSGGDFGIGTTSPTSLGATTYSLSVNSTAANATGAVVFQNSASQVARAGVLSGWMTIQDLGSANGISIDEQSNLPIRFITNTTERARITAGGYSKFSSNGTYINSTGTYHEFYQSANADGLRVYCSDNSAYNNSAVIIECARTTTNSTYNLFYVLNGNASGQCLIRDSGNIVNTNGSYGALSDQKLKQDIVDAASQWDDIKSLRVRKYRFKDKPDEALQIGIIAQELEQVSPGLVEESVDRDKEGNDLGTTTKSVKYSVLYMKAVKALQEAMARIEKLEAEMAALKGA